MKNLKIFDVISDLRQFEDDIDKLMHYGGSRVLTLEDLRDFTDPEQYDMGDFTELTAHMSELVEEGEEFMICYGVL